MAPYILVLWLSSLNGSSAATQGAITTATFTDKTSCERALAIIRSKADTVNGVCVPQ